MPVQVRPRVFSLYDLDEETRAYASSLFDLTCPGDEGWDKWYTEAEGIMVRSQKLPPSEVAKIGPRLKFVSKHGVGYDSIDVKGLQARGVVVTNTPGVNVSCFLKDCRVDPYQASAVAELALTLALTVARNVSFIDREIRAGKTITKAEGGTSGHQLTGRTLGLVGGGNIGYALGKMFYGAFGARVVVYDPYLSPTQQALWEESLPPNKFRRVSQLDDMLREADVVSLHVPLLDATRDLISVRELGMMKKTAILINTARGGIVNEEALLQALVDGSIMGAGLDAFSIEPPTLHDFPGLISHPRVVTTLVHVTILANDSPHIGAASLDVIAQTARSVVEHLHDAFSGNVRDAIVV